MMELVKGVHSLMQTLIHAKVKPFVFMGIIAVAFLLVGTLQSWSVSLSILNLCLISAIMAIGVNIQWGYAGLFNAGVMGFAALGGVSVVLVAKSPVVESWQVGGVSLFISFAMAVAAFALGWALTRILKGRLRQIIVSLYAFLSFLLVSHFYGEATSTIEAVNPTQAGYLGGMGMPVLLSWFVGGGVAAVVALYIGKLTLKLRADYLAIATLGLSEIILHVLKNEEWLARGVKDVSGLPRPVPYEVELQNNPWFISQVESWYSSALAPLTETARVAQLESYVIEASTLLVKLSYTSLFVAVLAVVLLLATLALHSPWGRMMHAIRDNEMAAEAMGKDVFKRHLQVFIIGSAIVGVAGAMLVTLDGQFTPKTYQPLRYTFLIWVMVIIGGSGNNYGSVLGAFIVWFIWVQAEPFGVWLVSGLTAGMAADDPLKIHFIDTASHLRLFIMGLILLFIMRFNSKGLLPENRRS